MKVKTTAKLPVLVMRFNKWSKGCGEKVEQNFDNQPRGILKAFPKVDADQVSHADLEENLWWWRKAKSEKAASIFRHNGVPSWTEMLFTIYQDHFERSAYYYELRARYDNRYQWDFGHPWIHCSRQQRRMLDCLWPNDYPARKWLPSDAGKPAWSRLDGVSFNLQLNDTVLIEQFLAEVERLRSSKAIRKPGVGQGVRRKPLSWRPIELLDIRRYRIRPLNDGERSHVSKVLRDYKAACQKARIEP